MKSGFESKHQSPYRLPPDKRKVLSKQLEDLASQGIITQVSGSEDVPIISPVVLVSKRKTKSSNQTPSQQYRFCCDFRHLKSQTQEFRYSIPNLQELTESFSDQVPNYITSIDLSSVFFSKVNSP